MMLGEFWIRDTRTGTDGRVHEVELAERKNQLVATWKWVSVESVNKLLSDGNEVFNCQLEASEYTRGTEVKHYALNFLKGYSKSIRS